MLLQTTMNTGGVWPPLPASWRRLARNGHTAPARRRRAGLADLPGPAPWPVAAPGLGQPVADVLIDVPIDRLVGAGQVLHRHARHLNDAGFDRVDQREIGHHPGKQRALRITGAAQEERRGRQVIDLHRSFGDALQRLDPADPKPRGGVVLLRLGAGFGIQLVAVLRLVPVAMVGFVVQHHDAPATEQFAADALDHPAVGFQRLHRAVAPAEDRFGELRRLQRFAFLEGVEIGDDYARALQVVAHVARHDVVAADRCWSGRRATAPATGRAR